MVFSTLAMMPFSTAAEYVLTTIPMFILMAYFSSSSVLQTISTRLHPTGCHTYEVVLESLQFLHARFLGPCQEQV
jgi:hypothetical protein